jgi:gamma-glutamylaminecyclotransferase
MLVLKHWRNNLQPNTPIKVFVYGTLKSGGEIRGLHQFVDGAVIVGKAYTTYPDYSMIDLGAFPGVLKGGRHKIQGEVWEVDQDTFEDLDAMEGYPEFYNRELTETTQGRAWMYHLPREDYADKYAQQSENITVQGDILIWNR